jgi:hypothetical protein
MRAQYSIHVTETQVAVGFGKFVGYQARTAPEGMGKAFPDANAAVQKRHQISEKQSRLPTGQVTPLVCVTELRQLRHSCCYPRRVRMRR